MVKMQNQNATFPNDCCVREFDSSPELNWWQSNHSSNLILVIKLNMMALKQSEPPGHDHYLAG